MTLGERIDEATSAFYVAVAGMLATAIAWVVRTIFTNAKKVEQLEEEIKRREEQRHDDRVQQTEVLNRLDHRLLRVEDRIMDHKEEE